MDLTPYVASLGRELLTAVETGGDDGTALIERLTVSMESAIRLTLLEALSAAADEITRDLAPGSVQVRLRGRDPDFVVTPRQVEQSPETPPTGARCRPTTPRRLRGRCHGAHQRPAPGTAQGRGRGGGRQGGPVGQRVAGAGRLDRAASLGARPRLRAARQARCAALHRLGALADPAPSFPLTSPTSGDVLPTHLRGQPCLFSPPRNRFPSRSNSPSATCGSSRATAPTPSSRYGRATSPTTPT